MKLSTENNYLNSWNLYEVARYVPNLKRVIRDKYKFIKSNEIQNYCNKYQNIGIYTSVFAYDTEDLEKATRLRSLIF
jgi:hypothetical protein